eukprot:4168149-Amphidinium_carterae.1
MAGVSADASLVLDWSAPCSRVRCWVLRIPTLRGIHDCCLASSGASGCYKRKSVDCARHMERSPCVPL